MKQLRFLWASCLAAFILMGAGCYMYTWISNPIKIPPGMDTGVVANIYVNSRGDPGKAFSDFTLKPVTINLADKQSNNLSSITRRIRSGDLTSQAHWLDAEDIEVSFFDGDPEKKAPRLGTWAIHFDKTNGKITSDKWTPGPNTESEGGK